MCYGHSMNKEDTPGYTILISMNGSEEPVTVRNKDE